MAARNPLNPTNTDEDRILASLGPHGKVSPEQADEFIRASPLMHFLTCAWIKDRSGTIRRPRPNILQLRFYEAWQYCLETSQAANIICCKPRKTGLSTCGQHAVYYVHRRDGAESLTMGDVLDTAETLEQMFERYKDYDDFPWGNRTYKEKGKWRATNGALRHLETAQDQNAGRGKTPQAFHSTEGAHYQGGGKRDAKTMMLGALNSVADIAGNLTLLESTPKGIAGFFAETYRGDPQSEDPRMMEGAVTLEDFKAGKKGNGFIKIFAAWYEFEHHVRPVSADEKREIINSLTKAERLLINKFPRSHYGDLISIQKLAWRRHMIANRCGGSAKQFDQEYPRDDVSCFLVSGNPRFDAAGLDRLELVASQVAPEYGRLVEQRDGTVQFQPSSADQANVIRYNGPPVKGREYLVSADTMSGEEMVKDSGKSDKNCILVRESGFTMASGRQYNASFVMRSMPGNRMNANEGSRLAWLMSKYYGDCIMFVEINNTGYAWVNKLQEYGANLSRREEVDRIENKVKPLVGWQTNAKTRKMIIDDLDRAIHEATLDVFSPDMVVEFRQFVTHPSGKDSASDGAYDDDVMSAAIAESNHEMATPYYGQSPNLPPIRQV